MAMKADSLLWLPTLLQTSDAFFPTGAYAHSLGFEEIVRLGLVKDQHDLGEYIRLQIMPALQNQELPYLRFAFEHAEAGDFTRFCEVDHEISAWKLPAELRAASTQIGQRRLAALRAVNVQPAYTEFAKAIQKGKASGHHLSVFALQAAVEGFPLEAAMSAWFYQTLSGICGAALKLIRIGQDGCQRIIREALGSAEQVINASRAIDRQNAGWFDPALEIASMRHALADERLFIS